MDFFDVTVHQGQKNFDWNDITVGNTQLDHSQNFFSKKHYNHERADEMEFLQQKTIKSEISDNFNSGKEIELLQEKMIKSEISNSQSDNLIADKENISKNKCLSLNDKQNEITLTKTPPTICKTKKEERGTSPVDAKKKLKAGQESCLKVAANLAYEWSSKKPICSQVMVSKGAVSKSMPPPPQAYLVKDIYQRNREEAERRRAEEEQNLRKFHSRPAPKFNHHHEQLLNRKTVVHAITVAVTPQVLKNSLEAEEKRRKRLEEWKQKNQPPRFEPRPPTVLQEKPFVPKIKPSVVQQCPFNLHMEKRLQERKHYNEMKQKALEEKQKQEEEERKRLEKEHIKEIRKATTFKARPNPFKN